jgi:hemolysin activation/secretion protein
VRLRLTFCALTVLFAMQSQVWAQTPASPAQEEQQLRQQEELQRQRERLQRDATPEPTPAAPTPAAPGLSDQPCFVVHTIRLDGVTRLDTQTVQRLTADYQGRCMGLLSIDQLMRAITQTYIDAGYVSARAYMQEQDISQGLLVLTVAEGILEGIDWNGEEKTLPLLRKAFGDIVGKPLNMRDIEQGIDQLSRLSSLEVVTQIKPGRKPGQSRVDVRVQEGLALKASSSLSNQGLESSGKYRYGLGFRLENALGHAESISVNLGRSSNNALSLSNEERPGSNSVSIAASLPFGYWLLSGDVFWSEYQGSLQTSLGTQIKTSGNALNSHMALERVVFRDKSQKLRVHADVSRAAMENYLSVFSSSPTLLELQSRVNSSFQCGLLYSLATDGAIWTLAFDRKQGIDAFGATAPGDAKLAGRDVLGQKYLVDVGLLKLFQVGQQAMQYQGSLSMQQSDNNLLGEEQMSVGGPSSVRGVPSGMFSGNTGLYLRNTVSTRFKVAETSAWHAWTDSLEPYLGLDYGRIAAQPERGIVEGELVGAAIGMRTRSRWYSLDVGFEGLLDAHPVAADFQRPTRWYFNLQVLF